MVDHVRVPVRVFGNTKWAALSFVQPDHEICGYDFRLVNEHFPFIGGHRVRLYKVKGNVHWRIPVGAEIDISSIPAAATPAGPKRRHHKG